MMTGHYDHSEMLMGLGGQRGIKVTHTHTHETVVVVRENNKVVLDYVCVGIVTVLSPHLSLFARSKYQILQQLN